MTVRIITEPVAEPITLAQAKLHCRLENSFTSDDTLIESLLIPAARRYAENITRRAYVQRTLELTLPCFPDGGVIELPFPPLISVTSVKYIDADGVLQTVAASDYQVDTYRKPGLLKPAYLESWPTITRSDFNAVQVRYEAGYSPSGSPASDLDYAANIPETLKCWMQVRVGTMYEHRESIIVGNIVSELSRNFIDSLLDDLVVDLF